MGHVVEAVWVRTMDLPRQAPSPKGRAGGHLLPPDGRCAESHFYKANYKESISIPDRHAMRSLERYSHNRIQIGHVLVMTSVAGVVTNVDRKTHV